MRETTGQTKKLNPNIYIYNLDLQTGEKHEVKKKCQERQERRQEHREEVKNVPLPVLQIVFTYCDLHLWSKCVTFGKKFAMVSAFSRLFLLVFKHLVNDRG